MAKKPSQPTRPRTAANSQGKDFHIELLNAAQKLAWQAFQQHDVLFLIGPAGTGKTLLATAFAIQSLLARQCNRIVMTRPIVSAGEQLGYLPGEFDQKVHPYMMPLYDSIERLVGTTGPTHERVSQAMYLAPLAYMRGRNWYDSVCICDEAQNATYDQLKMFLTRINEGCKVIIAGDPDQSDIPGPVALSEVVRKLSDVTGVGVVEFKANSIVRHPLVARICERLEKDTHRARHSA